MKKIILIIITVVTMLGISACGDKQSNQSTVTDDYRYSSYTYDDNAPQYYMAGSAAASETGYYYIDGAPVINNSNMYIYYYDMIKDMTIPLCSKVDCDHRTDECEAYISQNICVGSKIWYHNERLYMIEKTEEKDILVSYDKTMRDKKEEKTLSINGLSFCNIFRIRYDGIIYLKTITAVGFYDSIFLILFQNGDGHKFCHGAVCHIYTRHGFHFCHSILSSIFSSSLQNHISQLQRLVRLRQICIRIITADDGRCNKLGIISIDQQYALIASAFCQAIQRNFQQRFFNDSIIGNFQPFHCFTFQTERNGTAVHKFIHICKAREYNLRFRFTRCNGTNGCRYCRCCILTNQIQLFGTANFPIQHFVSREIGYDIPLIASDNTEQRISLFYVIDFGNISHFFTAAELTNGNFIQSIRCQCFFQTVIAERHNAAFRCRYRTHTLRKLLFIRTAFFTELRKTFHIF